MEPFSRLLFLGLLMLTNLLQGQVVITNQDLPQAGDQLIFFQDSTSVDLDVGPAGEGQVWDFSNLMANDFYANRILTTEGLEGAELFPEADFALQVDSAFFFAKLTDQSLINLGAFFSTDLIDTNFVVTFDPPQTVLEFPVTFGDTIAQTYGFEGTIDGIVFSDGLLDSLNLVRTVVETIIVDAAGSVTTPTATYESLRLRINSEVTDSISGQAFGVWIPITNLVTATEEYRWLAKEGKGNVLSIFFDDLGDQAGVDWLNAITTNDVAAPSAQFSFEMQDGQMVVFTDESANNPTSWLWDFGDGNSSTEQSPTHTYATADTFEVCLQVTNEAGFNTICRTVESLTTSSKELQRLYGFQMFPNPVKSHLHMQLAVPQEERLFVRFSDFSGRVHHRQRLTGSQVIDVSKWPAGLYTYSVYAEAGHLVGSGKVLIDTE